MRTKSDIKTRGKGEGTVYKDGKRWYLKVRTRGKTIITMLRGRDGTPCTNEKDARSAAEGCRPILFAESKEQMAIQIAEAKKLRKHSGLLLEDAWEKYLEQPSRPDSASATLKNYKGILELMQGWIAREHPEIKRIADVDEDLAQEYFAAVWKSGVSEKRYNDGITALRLIFRHLQKVAGLDNNPFSSINKKPLNVISRKEFSAEQVAAIFRGFEDGFFYETTVEKLGKERKRERVKVTRQFNPMNAEEMRVLLNLCCWTGCRGQDGCVMEWKNVDFTRNIISYIPQKTARRTGHKAVTLPLHPDLRKALENALVWRSINQDEEDYILPKVAHRYHTNPSGIQKDVMKMIRCAIGVDTTESTKKKTAHRKLSVNAYSLHSFRHTFVSFCANAGIPETVVAEIVGHGNPAMTEHYSHISTESKQKAIDSLPIMEKKISTEINNTPVITEIKKALCTASEEQIDKIIEVLGIKATESVKEWNTGRLARIRAEHKYIDTTADKVE